MYMGTPSLLGEIYKKEADELSTFGDLYDTSDMTSSLLYFV